ncbi:MAG TPA: MOSC domain-containing protein [Candidatus Limnocylindrales bacterium]|nr:MOSC domain-containing protein [Candidatus Limnocylindrales bacterium]
MRIVSVNVGGPRLVQWQGQTFETSIYKSPVPGRIPLGTLNLEGDRQSDLSVHGGPDKAVYGYPIEHYEYWKQTLEVAELPMGAFGENLTLEGFREDDLSVGDILRAGSAELMVTQPRIPCFKLNARMKRSDMVKMFLASRRSGFYFCVLREGEVAAGDGVDIVDRATERMSVRELNDIYANKSTELAVLERAMRLRGLAQVWREQIGRALAAAGVKS